VNAYWFIPLGVATTIPAPGNGNGWIYFVSKLRAGLGLVANACRTAHGDAKAALAAAPHLKKDRLVIIAGQITGQYIGSLCVICETLSVFCWSCFHLSDDAGNVIETHEHTGDFKEW
jgi:hypothetical protein